MRLAWGVCLVAACTFDHGRTGVDDAPRANDASEPRDAAITAGDAALVDAKLVDASSPPPCTDTSITATKQYAPATVVDGTLTVTPAPKNFVLPAELPVTTGNAGNHCAEVTFHRTDGTLPRCRYRGGADVAHVGSDQVQVMKGQRYVFDGCRLGAACPMPNGMPVSLSPGALSAVDQNVVVHIDNGDDQAGTTQITVALRLCN